MDSFPIVIPRPADQSDAKLNKLYQKLCAERDALQQKRDAVAGQWAERSEVVAQMRAHQARPEDVAPVKVEMRELEIDLREREIALLQRILDEYIPAAMKHREHLVNVTHQMVELAEQEVIAELHRRFDPARWRMSDAALTHYVAHHPIVRGAHEALMEVRTYDDQDHRKTNRENLRRATHRLEDARGRLPALQELAKRAGEAAKEHAAAAAAEREQRQRAAEAHKSWLAHVNNEARKRIGLHAG